MAGSKREREVSQSEDELGSSPHTPRRRRLDKENTATSKVARASVTENSGDEPAIDDHTTSRIPLSPSRRHARTEAHETTSPSRRSEHHQRPNSVHSSAYNTLPATSVATYGLLGGGGRSELARRGLENYLRRDDTSTFDTSSLASHSTVKTPMLDALKERASLVPQTVADHGIGALLPSIQESTPPSLLAAFHKMQAQRDTARDAAPKARDPGYWRNESDINASACPGVTSSADDEQTAGSAEGSGPNPAFTRPDVASWYKTSAGFEPQSYVGPGDGGQWVPAPPRHDVRKGLEKLVDIRRPKRKDGKGHKPSPFKDDEFVDRRLLLMEVQMRSYTLGDGWQESAQETARRHGVSTATAKSILRWTRAFLDDNRDLPINPYGSWNASLLEDMEADIKAHLQSIGKDFRAEAIVSFTDLEWVQTKYLLDKPIHISTARRWLHAMEYRFGKLANGQYVDGHERDDVVEYRQQSYLPRLWELESGIRQYDSATGQEVVPDGTGNSIPWPPRRIVLWFHDESTFYANDRRWVGWAGPDAKATPRAKGEGQSLMVSDFFSPDYGWLRRRTSHPGDTRKQDARILFKAGKNRSGWFTNVSFVAQLEDAMSILADDYPFEKHVFILDNATIHTKRPETAPSARIMTKNPSKNVLANVTMLGDDGLPLLSPDGKAMKGKAKMTGARLHDGTPQPLYFPDSADACPPEYSEKAGQFKGMTRILEERGYAHAGRLRYQCDNFKCPENFDRSRPCCQRRLLYNEPDFVDVESLAEARAVARGFEVLFLPKFHCELNPVEQCWCMAKEWYRRLPPSEGESDLERNVVDSLARIPIESMRRFFNRSWRFGCAYRFGLNGKQAAWAAKQYHGHRVVPNSILEEYDRAHDF